EGPDAEHRDSGATAANRDAARVDDAAEERSAGGAADADTHQGRVNRAAVGDATRKRRDDVGNDTEAACRDQATVGDPAGEGRDAHRNSGETRVDRPRIGDAARERRHAAAEVDAVDASIDRAAIADAAGERVDVDHHDAGRGGADRAAVGDAAREGRDAEDEDAAVVGRYRPAVGD